MLEDSRSEMKDTHSKYKKIFNSLPDCVSTSSLVIPGYEDECVDVINLTSSSLSSNEQFLDFVEDLKVALGSNFYPVVRLSDGEFNFLLGDQWPGPWWPMLKKLKKIAGVLKRKLSNRIAFSNASYSGENRVSRKLARSLRRKAVGSLFFIGKHGRLAPHLSLAPKPFQADYVLPFLELLTSYGSNKVFTSMIPFYFVYPLLLSQHGDFLFLGQRVLLVHSAEGGKKSKIIRAVEKRGASSIHWLSIPNTETFDTKLELSRYIGKIDVVFFGLGVFKLVIIEQFACVRVPVIDAGYVFEVWNDPDLGVTRPFCKYLKGD